MAGESAGAGILGSGAGGFFGSISPTSWLSAGSSILGAAAGSPKPAISGVTQNPVFNNSGWTVSTGSSTANGAQTSTPDYILYGIIGLVAIVVAKKLGKK